MSRRHRPRPPGNVEVVCTGRDDPLHGHRLLRRLQLKPEGGRARLYWNQGHGVAPETGFRAADGWKTFEFRCPDCGRHLKRGEEVLVKVAFALAEHRGISGDDNTPIEIDISKVERL